ncbi:REP element-mobilizing transposase RayT [Mucilaginibacter gracilis]|uniref:REP element-mobilizing transposase RayT n=1 Tax=Mucilaginibacter gracilis TaxID=423350 RepID=A0A495J2U2_9SPHI|nr:transposase [Mucilaginibacter gracilis]RKR82991.1 REP element-mobilizing transposase RayT [Mucilaginibacter gracilis]
MSRNYKFHTQEKPHFITFSVVKWIDAFTRIQYREILLDSIKYCQQNKGLEVYAWVVMSNHVHMIIGTQNLPMQGIIRDLKKHTSKSIVKVIRENEQESRRDWLIWMFEREGKRNPNNEVHQFWQQDNHPIELYSNEVMQQKLDYIHNNPVKAGWVDEPQHYLYSSARDYGGGKGLLDVILMV